MQSTQKDDIERYLDFVVCAYQRNWGLPRIQMIGERIADWTSVIWKNTDL